MKNIDITTWSLSARKSLIFKKKKLNQSCLLEDMVSLSKVLMIKHTLTNSRKRICVLDMASSLGRQVSHLVPDRVHQIPSSFEVLWYKLYYSFYFCQHNHKSAYRLLDYTQLFLGSRESILQQVCENELMTPDSVIFFFFYHMCHLAFRISKKE